MRDLISKVANQPPFDHPPISLESIQAAIGKLDELRTFPKDHPFNGVFVIKKCAALKGSHVVIISGDTAYYWPDVFELKEVKILKLPKLELPDIKPEINFSWEFQSSPINWEL